MYKMCVFLKSVLTFIYNLCIFTFASVLRHFYYMYKHSFSYHLTSTCFFLLDVI